ncbi:hypothetical protein EI77_00075 [Prosthecobacter fusiformis]|uniref:Alpha/beta hydrolase family protein DUF900 n=1 Tax=Prosthecobacter fusiformis TaxID=48464 RepID=A0A4R7SRK1_9BACT|nr:alpha/beta hydrolase [Prosthecobacter fusiformis]TDU80778.1 hypothetical protein EI77_00075 [Prosthecobacter fusiformis]
MKRKLIFIHGRSQQFKDSIQLKAEWISAWKKGLKLNGLELPMEETDIAFPYYGQTLHDLVERSPEVAEIIIRGAEEDAAKKAFVRSVIEEIKKAKITDEQLETIVGSDVVERGPLNWPWVRGVLQAVDKYIPGGSGSSIALATNDVYQYLNSSGIRDSIESGVLKAISPGIETVVVSHSLGTVVAYNLLRREGESREWKVPLFVTLGSPLAVTAIKKALRPIGHPSCVSKWYNAMDPRDIVSLRPLDEDHFDISPSIENHLEVNNHTDNRHGIAGYLDDKQVAKRIYDALVA